MSRSPSWPATASAAVLRAMCLARNSWLCMFVRHHVFLRSPSSASSFIVVVVVVVVIPFFRLVQAAISSLVAASLHHRCLRFLSWSESVVCDSVPELRGLPADQWQRCAVARNMNNVMMHQNVTTDPGGRAHLSHARRPVVPREQLGAHGHGHAQ